jgi:hypothetical protein
MSKNHHGGPAPVPPGNRPQAGPGGGDTTSGGMSDTSDPNDGAAFHEQDPQRRLGGFESAGEHSRQQPGPLNDGGTTRR